jgi:histidyl-tRNA synthetase
MSLSTQPYKGARDFYPEDKRVQRYMFDVLRGVCQRFGYEEYDAPILEPTELFASKTSDEIVNEQTYTFEDRGGRSVTIRTEMTPSVSRMVAARRQELGYPIRWFSIPNIWRYERPQRGRLREFWQLNVDIFGVATVAADVEAMQVADSLLKEFGATSSMYQIRINSRKLVNEFLEKNLGLDETQTATLIRLIDKKDKMPEAEFVAEVDALFSPSQRDKDEPGQLLQFLGAQKLEDLPQALQESVSTTELKALFDQLQMSGISNAQFSPSLMRGFDYYTDIVFEVFDTDPENNRSMFGGGRYDGLVGLFGVEPVPTVGFGMGDVTLQNFLQSHGLLPEIAPEIELNVVLIGDVQEKAAPLVQELRQMGLTVAVDISGRKLDKQIQSAEKRGAKLVAFIGESEIKSNMVKYKNLQTGEEDTKSPQRLVSLLKDHRKALK